MTFTSFRQISDCVQTVIWLLRNRVHQTYHRINVLWEIQRFWKDMNFHSLNHFAWNIWNNGKTFTWHRQVLPNGITFACNVWHLNTKKRHIFVQNVWHTYLQNTSKSKSLSFWRNPGYSYRSKQAERIGCLQNELLARMYDDVKYGRNIFSENV